MNELESEQRSILTARITALESDLATARAERDAAVAAGKVLANYAACKLEGQSNRIRQAKRGDGVVQGWQKRTSAAQGAMMNNPLALAWVREAQEASE